MKHLRLFHVPTLSFLITVLYWTYRYIWFSLETIPDTRIVFAGMATAVTICVSIFVELSLAD